MTTRVMLPGLIPLTFQSVSCANSTAVAVNSTVKTARFLRVSVETNNARYRDDGTAPTLTTGTLLIANNTYEFWYNGTGALKFQRSTGTAKLQISAYQFAGDQGLT